jgi:hypothetical protein
MTADEAATAAARYEAAAVRGTIDSTENVLARNAALRSAAARRAALTPGLRRQLAAIAPEERATWLGRTTAGVRTIPDSVLLPDASRMSAAETALMGKVNPVGVNPAGAFAAANNAAPNPFGSAVGERPIAAALSNVGESAALGESAAVAGARAAGMRGLATGFGARAGLANVTLGSAAGGLIAAPIAGGLADRLNVGGKNSLIDQFVTGAAGGAVGAGLASKNPLGALAGAVVGGVGNVGYNALFHNGSKKSPDVDPQQRLDQAMSLARLSPESRRDLMTGIELQILASGESNPKKVAALRAATINQVIGQVSGVAKSEKAAAKTNALNMAAQKSIADMVGPSLTQQSALSSGQSARFRGLAAQAPNDAYRNALLAQADQVDAMSARNNAAYASNMAFLPQSTAMQRFIDQQDAYARQVTQAAMQKALTGGGGGQTLQSVAAAK